jgi:hypothetical protein
VDNSAPQPVAKFLGWFSIGLGLAEALTPNTMAKTTGVRSRGLLQAYGLRELVSGVGILTSKRPAFWLWMRSVGDGIDLATLARSFAKASPSNQVKIAAAAAAVLGVTALDIVCAVEHSRSQA